ncbi:mucin-5AC-like [Saccostrea echinata]|uniref:mucin-5AC-like n=1 Tax=Saccostrea echinata TaxID=191078 RepID=UPI002A7FED1C|nr:mucin-5AC-like [Saccostrea echinata]
MLSPLILVLVFTTIGANDKEELKDIFFFTFSISDSQTFYFCNTNGKDACEVARSNVPFQPNARYPYCPYDADIEYCDRYITQGWYRYSTTMLDKCVSLGSCGAIYPYWLNGSHPVSVNQEVDRSVCKVGFSSCCSKQVMIKIRHCGEFMAYCLPALDACPERYCFGESGECEPTTTLSVQSTTKSSSITLDSSSSTYPTTQSTSQQSTVSTEKTQFSTESPKSTDFSSTFLSSKTSVESNTITSSSGPTTTASYSDKSTTSASYDNKLTTSVNTNDKSTTSVRTTNKLTTVSTADKSTTSASTADQSTTTTSASTADKSTTTTSARTTNKLTTASTADKSTTSASTADTSTTTTSARTTNKLTTVSTADKSTTSASTADKSTTTTSARTTNKLTTVSTADKSTTSVSKTNKLTTASTAGQSTTNASTADKSTTTTSVRTTNKLTTASTADKSTEKTTENSDFISTTSPVFDHCSNGKDPCDARNQLDNVPNLGNRSDQCTYESISRPCDQDLEMKWYKGFKILNRCPKFLTCGAVYPVWMNGSEPEVKDGIVTREVCKVGPNSCCEEKLEIKVVNCSLYTAYCLRPLIRCEERYCFDTNTCTIKSAHQKKKEDSLTITQGIVIGIVAVITMLVITVSVIALKRCRDKPDSMYEKPLASPSENEYEMPSTSNINTRNVYDELPEKKNDTEEGLTGQTTPDENQYDYIPEETSNVRPKETTYQKMSNGYI